MQIRNKGGFTLIELIVVIGILIILSTIGFISYSGYLATARDSQRKADLSLISNSLKKISMQGADILGLVKDGSNTGTGAGKFFLKGKDLTTSDLYKAGNINFDLFQDIKDMSDPKTKSSYKIGVYAQDYEVAASLEETNTSYMLGSYKKRTSSGTISSLTGTIDSTNNALDLNNYNDALKFQVGDIISTGSISGSGNYLTIDSIVGTKIYLTGGSVSIIDISDSIQLANDDTGIIGNVKNGNQIINSKTDCINDGIILTIDSNQCPLQDSGYFKNLLPYLLN
ncbi:MAG: prepilin-type N-terminal cleavage/methylation domain-containing protein [Candidatus Gracilibacteria bacterium]|nr:prepilin-type N-terminal cleavage/methylation domain-containing protein [Candidatus Gracilibacteria bacterium]MDD3120199.1 prepilin-type N-terminal cleavage/methylation domain-containing protein [Candidatus Gracilibacteria bacterium]MDD4530691.1 prepilin-type N-terminal cleavage/methylation domain-containing protein [Candidatus Gracilibacteria bacterium]